MDHDSTLTLALPDTASTSTKEHERDHQPNKKHDHSSWHLKHKVLANKAREERTGALSRELGVTWNTLNVSVLSANAAISENVLSQFNIPRKIHESRQSRKQDRKRKILCDSHGCVKPGEMLLVLGRPGSGCTTLLNMLANRRKGYASVEGNVWYGSMTAKEAEEEGYRGQIVMNSEEEVFFPTLTVGQTMDFATRLKIPHRLSSNANADTSSSVEEAGEGLSAEALQLETKEFLLESMGIEHTHDTMVGNEFVRGVSGGERKRVSIIETLATRGSVCCWDNSTRGLDASTALSYTKAIRAMTDVLGLASIVTLYQAGNGIYELFDKVLVLDEGKQVYYGPLKQAKPYMESLGFVCREGSNVADYLTGVTVPTERLIKDGYEHVFPRNADMLLEEYRKSDIYTRMTAEYEFPATPETQLRTQTFKEAVAHDKHPQLPKSSPLTVSFQTQVKAAVQRQYQILWGDKSTFVVKQVSTLIQALIAGSLFYNSPANSEGLFVKSGALFFSLLYPALVSMSEVTDSFTGRPVLIKHKAFAFYHPAAFCIAQIAADFPILLFQITVFDIILYFMVGLTMTASAFFTYWAVTFATAMCMTAMFRAIGAACSTFDGASKFSGLIITATVMYTGYIIEKPHMHPWFVWIFWINPLSYGFEALMGNEFKDKVIPCAGGNVIPTGPGYTDSAYQSCAGVGGVTPGDLQFTGSAYLNSLSYSSSHVWRDFGILWAWWALYVSITVFATSRWRLSSENGPSLLIPRENLKHVKSKLALDEESQQQGSHNTSSANTVAEKTAPSSSDDGNKSSSSSSSSGEDGSLMRNSSVFTWKNLCYTVKTPSGDRLLLDNVQGWVKPGMLGALMGSSGAGKTTLLDVLAQRKTQGTIRGSILVDGRPLPISFQRSAGYCEQLDVHEPYATVREALEFSALLRQPSSTSCDDKLKYVDVIIDLLELHDIADTLIGTANGGGLSIEQRKRVTIGVELVAKPSILIFLDEPTSGLDGQSAFNTVRFLRKLADVGQAVLVTIHQPSAQLFAQFDTLLLLAKGGKTVYFGDIGDNGATVKSYFARYGVPCPAGANPAEHMIDVVSGHLSQGRDWSEIWLSSPEHTATTLELDRIISTAASNPPPSSNVKDDKDGSRQFATSLWTQTLLVTHRMNTSLYRNTDYINNKVILHIFAALFNGFSFWQIGNSVANLQMRLFTIFQFIFVAPGVIAQLQPLFIDRRDIYETREKKAKMYSWIAFVTGLIVSEFPYLCICAVMYFVCWYYTVGFPADSSKAGATFFVMLIYEFIYTGIGQFIAAYAPNAVFATLANPLMITMLVSFCGVLVPYPQIQAFWRYWMYYLNPFNYLMGSLLTFAVWDAPVHCQESEWAVFDTPSSSSSSSGNMTCAEYLADYLAGAGAGTYLQNPDATQGCKVCEYSEGKDYLKTLDLLDYSYGWRDAGITVIFALSSYALVYVLMKLRTKASKKAE